MTTVRPEGPDVEVLVNGIPLLPTGLPLTAGDRVTIGGDRGD